MSEFPFKGWIIFHCMYIVHFVIYSSVSGHGLVSLFGCFEHVYKYLFCVFAFSSVCELCPVEYYLGLGCGGWVALVSPAHVHLPYLDHPRAVPPLVFLSPESLYSIHGEVFL